MLRRFAFGCSRCLVIEFMGRTRAQLGTLPAGDQGTQATLSLMRKLVDGPNGAMNLVVREAAINLVRQVGDIEHNALGQLQAIYYFVRDRIMFVGDVAGVETLQSPRYTLHVKAGDCDDRATLMAALARAIGIPAELSFRVVAANPSAPRAFSHVFVMARINGRNYALDPTYHSNPFDYQYPAVTRREDFAL